MLSRGETEAMQQTAGRDEKGPGRRMFSSSVGESGVPGLPISLFIMGREFLISEDKAWEIMFGLADALDEISNDFQVASDKAE